MPGHCTVPLPLLSERDRHEFEAAVSSVGVVNFGIQAANGIGQTAGLVRLAPETMELLKAGATPISKGGWNLGALLTEGKFVHQVRWLPAGSAGAVGLLASIGPALALMAIQWQLSELSRQLERSIGLTSTVLGLVRGEQWTEARGQHDAVLAAYKHAVAVGSVTDAIWTHAQAQASETTLRKDMHLFLENVQRHSRQLKSKTKATTRREWIQDNGEAVLRDVDALFMVHRAWFVYQALRIGWLSNREDDRDRTLRDELVREAHEMRERIAVESEPLVNALHRHFRLMQVCPGGVGTTIRGRKHTPRDVARAAEVLAGHICRLRGEKQTSLPCLEPVYGWTGVDTEDKARIEERLRWILTPEERLLSVAGGSTTDWWFSDGWVVFTDQRILLCKEGPFLKFAETDRELPWSSVTCVAGCSHENSKGGPDLLLGGRDGVRVQFYGTTPWRQVADLARHLRAERALEDVPPRAGRTRSLATSEV